MRILAVGQPYLRNSEFSEIFLNAQDEIFTVGWYGTEDYDVVLSETVVSLHELYAHLPNGFIPEVIIYFDHGEFIRVTGLEESTVPTIFYSVDIHIHHVWHPLWSGCFDAALLAMKSYLHLFPHTPYIPPVEWCPLWVKSIGEPPTSKRATGVSFRGTLGETHPGRREFFEKIGQQVSLDFGEGPYYDLYNNSKIVLNDCINDDLNWRVFEALGSGALLITPKVSAETLELFPEGQSLITYHRRDVEDAVDKIKYYISHEEARQKIALHGYTAVATHHRAYHRAEILFKSIRSACSRPRCYKRFCAIVSYLKMASCAQGINERFERYFIEAACEAIDKIVSDTEFALDNFSEFDAQIGHIIRMMAMINPSKAHRLKLILQQVVEQQKEKKCMTISP